jgi:exodeoxyribonuclease X
MTAIIFDTETTGILNPEIIESSWMQAEFSCTEEEPDYPTLQFSLPVTKRYKPEARISMGAMATHHIMDEDLAGHPPSSTFKLPDRVTYMIGHNVDFDWNVAGSPDGIKRIDTLCLARKFWPECDSYSLSALTYYLFRSNARTELQNAHNAETDILLTGELLKAIVEKANFTITSFESLWELSESARIPEIMPFGKHKGEKIANVPADYKAWLMKQNDVDPYLVKALKS